MTSSNNGSISTEPHEVEALISDMMNEYYNMIQNNIQMQRYIEDYYLKHEAYIRQRVSIIDELQATLAEERHVMEIQHQECRTQISAARKQIAFSYAEERKVKEACQSVSARILKEEKAVQNELKSVERQLNEEDDRINELLERKYKLEEEDERLQIEERRQTQQERELERALREMEELQIEIEQRKHALEQKKETVNSWTDVLEKREVQLVKEQNALCERLQQIERDEAEYGLTIVHEENQLSYSNINNNNAASSSAVEEFPRSRQVVATTTTITAASEAELSNVPELSQMPQKSTSQSIVSTSTTTTTAKVINSSGGSVINSVSLSRRALMDDFDMTIEHEPLREEIELEESVMISDNEGEDDEED